MSKRKKIIIRILLILLSVILISTAIIVYQLKSNLDRMMLPSTEISTEMEQPEVETIQSETYKDFYTLVMGLDYREKHDTLLTDSLMVFHVIPQESIVKLVSIPRDLLVENTRGNRVKINSLFVEGYSLFKQKAKEDPSILAGQNVQLGAIKLDKAVLSGAMANTRTKIEEVLNIEIDHMMLVNFNTIISLVDEIGGIEIDVKRSMKYKPTNLYLEPGLQVLNGEDALGYARFREDDHGPRYFASDFERGERQQEVVKALADEVLSWGNITNVLKLLNIVSVNVKTDMDYMDMYSMITQNYDKFTSASFQSIPFPEHYTSDGDVIIPDEALSQLQASFHALEGGEPKDVFEAGGSSMEEDLESTNGEKDMHE